MGAAAGGCQASSHLRMGHREQDGVGENRISLQGSERCHLFKNPLKRFSFLKMGVVFKHLSPIMNPAVPLK